jgi:hypothetical protein
MAKIDGVGKFTAIESSWVQIERFQSSMGYVKSCGSSEV